MNNNFRIFVGDGTKGGARRASMYKVSKSFAQKFRNAGVSFFFSFFFPIFILIVCAPSKLSRDESASVQQVQRGKYTRVCINSRMKISSLFSSLEKQLFETACVCVCVDRPFLTATHRRGSRGFFFFFSLFQTVFIQPTIYISIQCSFLLPLFSFYLFTNSSRCTSYVARGQKKRDRSSAGQIRSSRFVNDRRWRVIVTVKNINVLDYYY